MRSSYTTLPSAIYAKYFIYKLSQNHSERLKHAATCDPFRWHKLTLIPTGIRNDMPIKEWDEITNPFPNVNGYTVEVWLLI